MPLAATSSDPNYATNNVETVVARGKVVTLGGIGLRYGQWRGGRSVLRLFPAGKVGPFFLSPGSAGLSKTAISFVVPATGADGAGDRAGVIRGEQQRALMVSTVEEQRGLGADRQRAHDPAGHPMA